MDRAALRQLLDDVAAGRLDPERALERLRELPFTDLGFAKVDLHRGLRTGEPEAVFCHGKTPAQVAAIVRVLVQTHANVLATRADPAHVAAVAAGGVAHVYHPAGRLIVARPEPCPLVGLVALVTAGTADHAVAEEAAVTLEALGNRVDRIEDCGVAGLPRLIAVVPRLLEANVLVVVAGMEGALPSVVAGLVDRPLVAVPTSVGYGAALGGLAALLGMLTACAPGLAVVNIDNGYGAAVHASRINRLVAKAD